MIIFEKEYSFPFLILFTTVNTSIPISQLGGNDSDWLL